MSHVVWEVSMIHVYNIAQPFLLMRIDIQKHRHFSDMLFLVLNLDSLS